VSTDLEDRLRTVFREDADGVDATPVLPGRVTKRARRRAVAWAATVAVLAGSVAAGTVLAVSAVRRDSPAPSGGVACTWSSVPAEGIDTDHLVNAPRAISVISATDAWMVGTAFEQREGGSSSPLVEHFDGSSWSVVDVPDSKGLELTGVAAVSADDVWFVGYRDRIIAEGVRPNPAHGGSVIALFHWDGSTVSDVAAPEVEWPNGSPLPYAHAFAASASASSDVWAVGNTAAPNVQGAMLSLHWDGSSWTVVRVPEARPGESFNPRYEGLQGVSARTPDDTWAVGYSTTVPMSEQFTVIEHWDGRRWSLIPSPNVPPDDPEASPDNSLFGVDASGPDNAWAVGQYSVEGLSGGSETSTPMPLVERWDGERWVIGPLPDVGVATLQSVVTRGAEDVWAVGTKGGGGPRSALAIHWNGTGWTEAALDIQQGQSSLDTIAADPDGGLLALGTVQSAGVEGGTLLAQRCD
jgi:hypothetical protein